MSDPLSNSEIQDVLSSIRRLVSEDRRARERQAPVDAVPGTPVVGKLILTEALRVETTDEVSVETEEAPFAIFAEDSTAGDAPVVGLATPERFPPVRPASVLEDDIASLESTIAELEAAVAGISSDFEPDGSEIVAAANTPETRALEDAFDEGFAVDTGDPVRVAPSDAFLDEPVAGSGFRPAAKAADEATAHETSDETAEAEVPRPTDEIAFLRSPGAMRRADWQVISGGEGGQTAGAGVGSRLHLRPAGAPAAPADDEVQAGGKQHDDAEVIADAAFFEAGDGSPAGIDDIGEAAAAPDLWEAPDGVSEALLPEAVEETAALDPEVDALNLTQDETAAFDAAAPAWQGDTVAETDADVMADLAVEDAADEVAGVAESELIAPSEDDLAEDLAAEPDADAASGLDEEARSDLAEEWRDELAEDQAAVEIPEDLETTLVAAAGLARTVSSAPDEGTTAEAEAEPEAWGEPEAGGATVGDAATGTDGGADALEDEVDLFASDDEAVIDMEMLRELIVQVLREELQGPLGERITRNVRKLVRQEIARALESQKFE